MNRRLGLRVSLSALALFLSLSGGARHVRAAIDPGGSGGFSGFGGTATYTGVLGPVTPTSRICICLSAQPDLSNQLGCFEVTTNGGRYDVPFRDNVTFYAITFMDRDNDIHLDPGEPYVIYNGRSAAPADPIVTGPGPTDASFAFGDENIWPTPTATPTRLPTNTPTATEVPTASPTGTSTPLPSATGTPEGACTGDCDSSFEVTVDELIAMVNIALGNTSLATCPAGDVTGDGEITVDEIIAGANAALAGCPG